MSYRKDAIQNIMNGLLNEFQSVGAFEGFDHVKMRIIKIRLKSAFTDVIRECERDISDLYYELHNEPVEDIFNES